MAEGVIKRLVSDRGFGFIHNSDGKDLFFHSNNLIGMSFDTLKEGQSVEFEIGQGTKGPMAVRIKPVRVEIPQYVDVGVEMASGKDNTRARRRATRNRSRKDSFRDW